MDYCPPMPLCLQTQTNFWLWHTCMYNHAGATLPEQLLLDCRDCHLLPALVKQLEKSANPARNKTEWRNRGNGLWAPAKPCLKNCLCFPPVVWLMARQHVKLIQNFYCFLHRPVDIHKGQLTSGNVVLVVHTTKQSGCTLYPLIECAFFCYISVVSEPTSLRVD